MERLHYMMFKWNFNCVLNFSKDVVLWMSLGRSFHRIMARGRKLLSVDFLLTTGTGYDDFLKLYILDVDIVSGKRDDKYLGESFWRILNSKTSEWNWNLFCKGKKNMERFTNFNHTGSNWGRWRKQAKFGVFFGVLFSTFSQPLQVWIFFQRSLRQRRDALKSLPIVKTNDSGIDSRLKPFQPHCTPMFFL